MEWGKLAFLLAIILIGYLPYKTILKLRNDGLSTITLRFSLLMSAWFIVLSLLLLFQIQNFSVNASTLPVVGFVITTAIWCLAPWTLRHIGKYPTEIIKSKPKWYLLRTEPKTYILKYCEVLFQQTQFAYLLFEVFGGMTFISRLWWFTGIVGFLHIFNIFFVPSGWLFFLMSIPMGPLFSWFILNGYISITTTIHLWFYLLLVSWYWLRR